MSILDFKEIPEAHKGSGEQDTWEQFAREFLEYRGFQIIFQPSRGADLGRDLIAKEIRTGPGGTSEINHLVSCKHKAHSGSSISHLDEPDINDRLQTHHCDAFIGFYSTIPADSLSKKLREQKFEARTLDAKQIEKELMRRKEGIDLARRYFPVSMSKWLVENPKPIQLFDPPLPLVCEICNQSLARDIKRNGFLGGIMNFCISSDSIDDDDPKIVDLRWSCKGNCDDVLGKRLTRSGLFEDGWEDVEDFLHPYTFAFQMSSLFHEIQRMNDSAARKFGDFIKAVFPYVTREETTSEKETR